MTFSKSHFVFSRSQQNGIFILIVLIIIFQLVYFLTGFSSEEKVIEEDSEELLKFQAQIDSLKQVAAEADTVKIYPFNPNFVTDYRGYTLGLSLEEIDRLHQFREEDKWINSKEDFQEVTGVSDSVLAFISPYFRFPDWVTENQIAEARKPAAKSFDEKEDLNIAEAEDLQQISGIGEVLSGRIINYRNSLGGFVADIQLKDVYGLNYEVRDKLLAEFTVKTETETEILNINSVGLLELSEVPYINYELAREIIDYRLIHEGIDSFEELSKIEDFPFDKIDRIALYLGLD